MLERLLPVYEKVLKALADAGAEWIQIDEPCLALDLEEDVLASVQRAYTRLSAVSSSLRLLLATYFGELGAALPVALHLPVAAVHLDLVRAPDQFEQALAVAPSPLILSLGVVDGRNIWRTDFDRALTLIEQGIQAISAERLLIGPSCSLLHVPADLTLETHTEGQRLEVGQHFPDVGTGPGEPCPLLTLFHWPVRFPTGAV